MIPLESETSIPILFMANILGCSATDLLTGGQELGSKTRRKLRGEGASVVSSQSRRERKIDTKGNKPRGLKRNLVHLDVSGSMIRLT